EVLRVEASKPGHHVIPAARTVVSVRAGSDIVIGRRAAQGIEVRARIPEPATALLLVQLGEEARPLGGRIGSPSDYVPESIHEDIVAGLGIRLERYIRDEAL